MMKNNYLKSICRTLLAVTLLAIMPQGAWAQNYEPTIDDENEISVFFQTTETTAPKVWVWGENNTNYCTNKNWPGDAMTYMGTNAEGARVYKWTYTGSNTALPTNIIFTHNGETKYNDVDGIFVNHGYYSPSSATTPSKIVTINGIVTNNWVLMASGDGQTWESFPLTASRDRNSGPASGIYYSVGKKAEQLPFKDGKLYWYITRASAKTYYFAPNNGSWVDDYASTNLTVYNTNLSSYKYYENSYHKTTSDFVPTTSNTFVLKPDANDIVSYTFAINASETEGLKRSDNNLGSGMTVTRNLPAKTVAVYQNRSINYVFKNKFTDSYQENTNKFYLVGSMNGVKYTYDQNYPMTRQEYKNPVDENKVDSVVYNITVQKGTGFDKLFLSFGPSQLWESGMKFGTSDKVTGNGDQSWNFLVRPEVQDTKDALALSGSLFVCGNNDQYNVKSNTTGLQNGNQALNPGVSGRFANKAYYIVHMNITTSTYNIEFVDKAPDIEMGKIRTYASKMPLDLPKDGTVKAYSVQKATFGAEKDMNGEVELRSLSYIPADEGVVLIYTGNEQNYPFTPTVRTRDLVEDPKDLWTMKSVKNYTDEYVNYLVPVYNNMNVYEGDLDRSTDTYRSRNFLLAYLNNNYGFYRAKSKSQLTEEEKTQPSLTPNHAYMVLPQRVLNKDAQGSTLVPDEGSVPTAASKKMFLMSFDDDPFAQTTGIENINAVKAEENNVWYNLQGMRVSKPEKGVYIHNGKKIVVK